MNKNFKVGDKVRIDLSANYDGPCFISELMRPHDGREATITGVTDSSTDGTPRYNLDIDGSSYFYVNEWLTLVEESNTISIPVVELKRIYDVACDAWKKKLSGMVEPFESHVTITQEFAQSMIFASTASQKPIVLDVLTSAGFIHETSEFFDFGDTFELSTFSEPLVIKFGMSSPRMEQKEIGFKGDYEVYLCKDGEDDVKLKSGLSGGHYLKFKMKK